MTHVIRSAIAAILLIASTALQAATTYRVTITRKDGFKRPPLVGHVIADGENRRLTYENQEEPFTEDVLLSTDGGKTVTALNTKLRTWFAVSHREPTETGLPPWMSVQIKDTKVTVTEEPWTETISGYPLRKFVIRAGYTTREDYSGTKVNRIHTMTELLWTTDKIDRSLAFPIPEITIGVRSLDAELRQKTGSISGFPLRDVRTISRAYEGGAPSVEMTTIEVDDIRSVPSPPASQFLRPAGYVNQEPMIGVPGK
jgi:hypothetical protein